MPAISRPHGCLLLVNLAPIAYPSANFNALRVLVRPVHQATQLIPFVHTAEPDPVTNTEWHAFCQVDIVRNQ